MFTTTRESLLTAVGADPSDLTAMGMYADCLAELGETDEERTYRLAIRLGGEAGWYTAKTVEEHYGLEPGVVRQWENQNGKSLPPREHDCRNNKPQPLAAWAGNIRRFLEPKVLNELRTAARYERLKTAWLEKAAAGDPRALLAHPDARLAVQRAVTGGLKKRHPKPSEYCSSKKVVAAAKTVLEAREARRLARATPETAGLSTKAEALYAEFKKRALAVAWKYHRETKSLFRSERATIVYGRGGESDSSFPYRGSYKGWRASWKNAGARLDDERQPSVVILENHLGNVVARIPFPRPK